MAHAQAGQGRLRAVLGQAQPCQSDRQGSQYFLLPENSAGRTQGWGSERGAVPAEGMAGATAGCCQSSASPELGSASPALPRHRTHT